jgi:hypothetical protein
MIDIPTLSRTSNAHPRALLPRYLGTGVPYSVKTACASYLLLEGYFKPWYIQFSTCDSVFLSQKYYAMPGSIFTGINGIFDKGGDGREEVPLGSRAELRAVRLFGLEKTSHPSGNGAFLQVSANRRLADCKLTKFLDPG